MSRKSCHIGAPSPCTLESLQTLGRSELRRERVFVHVGQFPRFVAGRLAITDRGQWTEPHPLPLNPPTGGGCATRAGEAHL